MKEFNTERVKLWWGGVDISDCFSTDSKIYINQSIKETMHPYFTLTLELDNGNTFALLMENYLEKVCIDIEMIKQQEVKTKVDYLRKILDLSYLPESALQGFLEQEQERIDILAKYIIEAIKGAK
jgi:hypothetical protein